MSNAGYIMYLQTVAAANATAIDEKRATVAALDKAVAHASERLVAHTEQIAEFQADMQQLTASNLLLANLISMLRSAK